MSLCCTQNMSDPSVQGFTNVTYVVHERFIKGASYDWDIAIIRLPAELTFNAYVQPVCLPSSPLPAGTVCVVVGWSFRQSKHRLFYSTRPRMRFRTMSSIQTVGYCLTAAYDARYDDWSKCSHVTFIITRCRVTDAHRVHSSVPV